MDTAYFLNAVSHLNNLYFCIKSLDSILIRVLLVLLLNVDDDDDDGVVNNTVDGDNEDDDN